MIMFGIAEHLLHGHMKSAGFVGSNVSTKCCQNSFFSVESAH